MLKIDVDEFTEKERLVLQIILHSMPCPFFVRISSSRTGLHIAVPQCAEWDYRRIAYDDPMRVQLDSQREHKKMPVKNLLWDVKNGLIADRWRIIRNSKDVEKFLDSITTLAIYTHKTHCNLSLYGIGTEKC